MENLIIPYNTSFIMFCIYYNHERLRKRRFQMRVNAVKSNLDLINHTKIKEYKKYLHKLEVSYRYGNAIIPRQIRNLRIVVSNDSSDFKVSIVTVINIYVGDYNGSYQYDKELFDRIESVQLVDKDGNPTKLFLPIDRIERIYRIIKEINENYEFYINNPLVTDRIFYECVVDIKQDIINYIKYVDDKNTRLIPFIKKIVNRRKQYC